MQCVACHRPLPPLHLHARRCVCGALVPASGASGASGASSAYRPGTPASPSPSASRDEPAGTCACTDLGALTARICARCRRPRACVRCPTCLDLVATGTERCPRCAAALELEAVPERTYVPCPRCAFALSALTIASGPVDECERCGGLFVAHATMRVLIDMRRPRARTPLEAPPTRGPFQSSYPPPAPGAPIAYLPCPTCGQRMNRKLFGQGSALVVDTCAIHGTWFDHGRLTTALAFVALGGLEVKPSATYARAEAKKGTGGAGASAKPPIPAPVTEARRRR